MHPAVKVLLVILGIILLLPGACGVIFMGIALYEGDPGMVAVFAVPSIAVGVGGIFLLRHVLRKRP
jgi:hypothetical protein